MKSELVRKAVQEGKSIEEARQPAVSYAPEVIADSSRKWAGNGLRFATREEAEANVKDLMRRWMLVTDTRVVVTFDPVNYKWVDGKLVDVAVQS